MTALNPRKVVADALIRVAQLQRQLDHARAALSSAERTLQVAERAGRADTIRPLQVEIDWEVS